MLLYQYNQLTEFLFSLKLVIKFSLRWVTRCRSDVRFISPVFSCLSPLQDWQLICFLLVKQHNTFKFSTEETFVRYLMKLQQFTIFFKGRAYDISNECVSEWGSEWVSEWVSESQISNLSAISRRKQVDFQWDDDDEVCFVLDQHTGC